MSALAEALLAAQRELPIALERNAQGAGYRYMTLDALLEACRPVLNAHGLSLTQTINEPEHGKYPRLRTVLAHAESGEVLSLGGIPLVFDPDRGMQSLGAAITYARRYAIAAALGIASEEDNDAATDQVPF